MYSHMQCCPSTRTVYIANSPVDQPSGPHLLMKCLDYLLKSFAISLSWFPCGLSEYCTSYQKLACFVFYHEIINNFLKNELCILKKNLFSRNSKNGIEILVGQEVFKLQIKTVKMLVWINNSRTDWPTLILMPFFSFLDNLLQDAYIIFQQDVDNFEIEHKTC